MKKMYKRRSVRFNALVLPYGITFMSRVWGSSIATQLCPAYCIDCPFGPADYLGHVKRVPSDDYSLPAD
jgi:hypothetical protein